MLHILLFIFILINSPDITSAACEGRIVPLFEEVPMPKSEGYYYNCNFGYSVIIPKGFVGESDSGPAQPVQHHGFGIELSGNPRAVIRVSGDFNSGEYRSFEEIGNSDIRMIRDTAVKMISVAKYGIRLSGFPAMRIVLRYRCPDNIIVYDEFIAFHFKRQKIYTMTLECDEKVYEKYKKILEKIAYSWQIKPTPCKFDF